MVTGRRSGLHQIGTNFDQYDGQPGPDPMSPLRPVVACTLCLACLTCTEDSTRSGPTGPRAATLAPTGPVLVGAGDIARCNGQGDEATAALLDGIPGTVFTAGNNVYGSDSVTPDFTNCYGPSWGRFKARTRPAVGSHEYYSPGAATYWQYFGAAAGDSGAGYYSYELGSWHIIVLNSGVDMRVASPQEQWLRADLAAHPALCTLAYWHHPLFSSSTIAVAAAAEATWQDLYDAGAELIINGHHHDYERFAPQTAAGVADAAHGIREIVVGTGGGEGLLPFAATAVNSEVKNNETFGVLKLTLGPLGYDWKFIPIEGKSFTDSGSGTCHTAPGLPLPQTINFDALQDRTFGDAPFSVSGTATSSLPVSYTVGSGDNCTIAGSTVTITGAGTCSVTATQPGDAT